MSIDTNSEAGLQSIHLQPMEPAVYAPNATAEHNAYIIERYNKSDWYSLAEICVNSISRFVKDIPSPTLSGSQIHDLHYGAIAFNKLGENEKYLACLKILFSLRKFISHLNSDEQELLNVSIEKYYSAAEELGVEYLNKIQVSNLFKKGGGCFIATAVYGSPVATEVIVLKTFRDNILLKHTLGRLFVKFYYWSSPIIAKCISKNNYLKNIIRKILIVPLIRAIVNHEKEY